MDEINFELSRHAKETLSWMLVAELLKHLDGPRVVLVQYPFEGHYDCLTISSPNEQHQILLNRLGANALAHGEVVEAIWSRAAYCPRETAFHIMSEANLPAGDSADINLGAITGATRIAQFLAEDMSVSGEVTWAWVDLQGGDPVHPLLGEFSFPDEWRAYEAPTESTSWAAWIYVLSNSSGLQALVNLKTGEMLDKAGKPWRKWRNPQINDEEGYPTTAIAYVLSFKEPGSAETSSWILRPSLARGVFKVQVDEADEVELNPVTSVSAIEHAHDVWITHDVADYL
jgi:hypothetical protein